VSEVSRLRRGSNPFGRANLSKHLGPIGGAPVSQKRRQGKNWETPCPSALAALRADLRAGAREAPLSLSLYAAHLVGELEGEIAERFPAGRCAGRDFLESVREAHGVAY
jgi:hypothetical protein